MWATDQALIHAVKTVKRSDQHRALRPRLASVAPCDVWRDDGEGAIFILFRVHDERTSYLGFAVDERGDFVRKAGLLRLDVAGSSWRARNLGVPGDSRELEAVEVGG